MYGFNLTSNCHADDGVGISVWVGANSGLEHSRALDVGLEFLESTERVSGTAVPITRLLEGSENQVRVTFH
jgi:hypothetical protein